MKSSGALKAARMRVARDERLTFPEPFFWTTAGIEQLRSGDPEYRRHIRARALDALNSSADQVKLAAEGDSWFDHPCVREAMDWFRDAGYAVYRSDAPGRLLATMLREKVYLRFLDDSRVRAVLLSGGGNDLINWKRPSQEEPSPIFKSGSGSNKPEDYLNFAELGEALAAIVKLLAEFARDVRGKRPGMAIITHCYDWFEPKNSGPWGAWVGPQMEQVGVPNRLRKKVAVLLINYANERYQRACTDLRMTYVNLRGITQGRWYDEIHPNDEAFKDIATKLMATVPKRKSRSKKRSGARSQRRRALKSAARRLR